MPYTHLTAEEREVIYRMSSNGETMTAIAEQLGRHPGTISRELRRNSRTVRSRHIVRRCYSAVSAQKMAEQRRHQKRSRKLDCPELQKAVCAKLNERWSPEQIAGRLKLDHPDSRARHLCHQTIYSWIHEQKHLFPQLLQNLRRRGKRYRYGRLNVRQMFPERRRIEDRPEVVNGRGRVGDWEGDTVHGAGRSGHLATFVDRRSGFLVAGKLQRLESVTLTNRTRDMFRKIPKRFRRTLTLDNGVEFSDHLRLERLTDLQIWFARPYCSGDRGTNENTNGLLRDYFPKKMKFDEITHQELAKVVSALNNRPRKRLGYRTPSEVFNL